MHDPVINVFMPYTLVLIIPDVLILHLALLLYGDCRNIEQEIKATLTLRDHIGLNESELVGVSYTGMPSGLLFGNV